MIKSLIIGCLAIVLCGCTLTTYRHHHEPIEVWETRPIIRHYKVKRYKYYYKKKRRAVIRHKRAYPVRSYYWYRY